MYDFQNEHHGRTAELQATRRRLSQSQGQNLKPSTGGGKEYATIARQLMARQLPMRKNEQLKAYNVRYKPVWRKQSLLDQLNRSLSVKQQENVTADLPKHLLIMQENEDYELQRNYFFSLIRKLPTDRLNRNEDNMSEFVKELPKLNYLFKGHSFLYICSLFKVGRIRFFQEGDIIYEKKQQNTEFSIILWGKIRMSDKKQFFRKISRRGQTLSQEVLFTEIRTRQEKATALQQCYLLDLDLKSYHIFYETMIANKLKSQVLTMQKNIKRNFIAKNSLRATRLS